MIQPEAIPPYPRGDIRSGAGWVTRFVEGRLASRHGWNLDVLQGREEVFPGSRTGGVYRVRNPARYFSTLRPVVERLQVREWLRFGNSVRQLTHVFALAERLGVRHIGLPASHAFYRGRTPVGFALTWGDEARRFDLTLAGYFLHVRALMPPLDAATQLRIVRDCVGPMLSPELQRPDPRVGAADLVLHFRGGDAFDTVDVKRGYWQPPLAYYLATWEREQARRVWLVFEDRRNPTIAAAESALRRRGVDVQLQSATLAEDLRVLLSARTLVASQGTFIPAVAALSSRLETYCQFSSGANPPNPSSPFQTSQCLTRIDARDVAGDFTTAVIENWRACDEQLATMLSYPMHLIRLERAGGS